MLGLTQQQASQAAGISTSNWRRIENKRTVNIRPDTARSVEKVLSLPPGGLDDLRNGNKVASDFPLVKKRKRVADPLLNDFDREAQQFNQAFKSGVVSPRMAAKLALQCDFVWDYWVELGREEANDGDVSSCYFLPELSPAVLMRVTVPWMDRLMRTVRDTGNRLNNGEIPYPRNTAEEVILWCLIDLAESCDNDDLAKWNEEPWATYDAYPDRDQDFETLREILFEDTDFLYLLESDASNPIAEQYPSALDPFSWWMPFR